MSTVAATTKKTATVAPFAIEAGTPRNQDIIVQCLDRLRLRGAVRAVVEVFDRQWGDDEEDEDGRIEVEMHEGEKIPTRPAPAKLIDGVGELPGMVLKVNPGTCQWECIDPLWKKEAKLERLRKALSLALGMTIVDQKLRGMKPRRGRIDQDKMKTLCRELLCFIDAGEARVIKGVKPERADIDALPGRYLLNWSNLNNWRQPKYEGDYEGWEQRMNQLSGGDS